jgi:hypothetical protein
MRQRQMIIVLLILSFMGNLACSKKSEFEGVVARKWSENAYMILVISKISDETLKNGTRNNGDCL